MPQTTKKALVLSGGAAKGAFQAGAIKAIFESGFKPEFIYGISVGALNGTYICNEAGKQNQSIENLDWSTIATNLINFWKDNIKKPADIVEKRNWLSLAWSFFRNTFDGLVDSSPIQNLVEKTVDMNNLYVSPIELKVGAVNIIDSKLTYADPSYPGFIQYLIASASLPMIMPLIKIGNQPFTDGGVRDVAPLKIAIDNGATDIIVVTCQPKDLGGVEFDTGNLLHLTDRIFEIMVNEIVNNDLKWAEFINQCLPDDGTHTGTGPLAGRIKLKITTIRPPVPINLNLQKFTSQDILNIINTGYQTAQEILGH